MITYGISILPFIKNLKREIPDITQPWYADDARVLGTFAIIGTYFDLLSRQGLGCGYYPEPSKSVLNVHLENLEDGKEFGHITDLRCAQAHVIFGLTLGMTSPRVIV